MAVVVEVLEGGADTCDDALFPRFDVFVVESHDEIDWVQMQVAADMAVLNLLVGHALHGGSRQPTLTFNPLRLRSSGLCNDPDEMMTLFALITTSLVTLSASGPIVPPFLSREVQSPTTPVALFSPPSSSNNTLSALKPSMNSAPFLAA